MTPARTPFPIRGPQRVAAARGGFGPAMALAALLSSAGAEAAPAAGKPLRADHPLIGAWALRVPDAACTEVYRISREGTSLVTSADEVAQTTFQISDRPDARGFYKWVDTIVKDNGKKDCGGGVTKTPHTTTSFVMMNEGNNAFISCENESTKACIGPFVKIEGGEI
jgi:hypothetical protein